jgi:hypothetical protein
VRTIAFGSVAALVSDVPGEELRAGRDELVRHGEVLQRVLERGGVLPMRFGMVMADDDDVREQLLERFHDELAMQLEELNDKVELHVRAIYDEQALMAEIVEAEPQIAGLRRALRDRSPDAGYYERIELGQMVAAAVERSRELDTQAMIEALAPLAHAAAVEPPEHEHVAAHICFLVGAAELSKFDKAVDDVGRRNAGRLRLKYTGPLPAYSFVELPA